MALFNFRLNAEEKKIVFLSTLGGALEFYDFIVYMYFASVISQLFFPSGNQLTSLIEAFAVFALGYLMRPLGGILFGHFGDKYGRKKTFIAAVLCMAIPTFLIGLLPTTQMVGITATFLLMICRIFQGISVGGEIPGSITFACEHVALNQRGLACGLIIGGVNSGVLLGSCIGFLINMFLTPEQVLSWGWRIPFIIGGLLGIASYSLRKKLHETPIFKLELERMTHSEIPIVKTFKSYSPAILKGVAISAMSAIVVSLLFQYFPTYLVDILHYPKNLTNGFNTISILLLSLLVIPSGNLSDKLGRKKVLAFSAIGFAITAPFLFYLLVYQASTFTLIFVMSLSTLIASGVVGVFTSTLAELFPTRIRFTGIAISYNLGFIFGGLTPLIVTTLISVTNNSTAPAYYLVLASIVCLLGSFTLKDQYQKPLMNEVTE
ncbi:MAG: MFS transporter [Proteobacteria bacterium]|nr:MFS transporter [Pseudomonadota bacterium]